MKKYKLTSESIECFGRTLYRIEAISDFVNVSKGDKGGFIEKEENLSQEGSAWVFGNAWVSGDAWVYGDARVSGNARVYGDARVYGPIKCETGWYFARKVKSWEVTEVPVDDDTVLLVKDYKPAKEEPNKVNLSGKTVKVTFDGTEYEAVIK